MLLDFKMTDGDFQNPRVGRRQYLITYSQADAVKFPTRESFGKMLEAEFNAGNSRVKVSHWACCKENHQLGGFHYHCCMKLTGVKKWLSVKNNIMRKHNIVVNFSETYSHYIYAYRYVCKDKPLEEVSHSQGHPDLSEVGSPRTKASTEASRAASRKRQSTVSSLQPDGESHSTKSRRRLNNLEVSDYLIANNIISVPELFAKAESRKEEGECDLAMFLFSRTQKALDELISKAWLLKNASSSLALEKTTRLEKVRAAAAQNCIEGCNSLWIKCALEVLAPNGIEPTIFASYIYELLTLGRGKFRNLMIYGLSNCAKTFILKPLKNIFGGKLLDNPANDKYAWVGAEKAEVILLQDFRFSKDVIAWKDLLLLLEGETVKLPSPKNHFAKDVVIDSDVPIFATNKSPITYKGPFNVEDERETDMMNSRWRIIKFKHVFEEKDQRKVKPCGSCFAKLILMAAN